MASLRKRSHADNDAPVSTPPRAAEPAPTEPPAPLPEEIKTASPADEAGKSAIQQRLAEMDNAQRLGQQPQQRVATEPIAVEEEPQQAVPEMPAPLRQWLAEHPQYLDQNDALAQAELNLATMKCVRDGKTWDAPDFIETIERHLGLRPATNGNAAAPQPAVKPIPRPTPSTPTPTYRAPAPVQQRYAGPPVSAPPTREAPSMTTGRPRSARVPLTEDELLIARQSGQTPEQYQAAKEMLLQQGRIGPGARDGR